MSQFKQALMPGKRFAKNAASLAFPKVRGIRPNAQPTKISFRFWRRIKFRILHVCAQSPDGIKGFNEYKQGLKTEQALQGIM